MKTRSHLSRLLTFLLALTLPIGIGCGTSGGSKTTADSWTGTVQTGTALFDAPYAVATDAGGNAGFDQNSADTTGTTFGGDGVGRNDAIGNGRINARIEQGLGTVEPVQSSPVRPQITGTITEVAFRTGFGDSNWADIITILRMAGFVGSIDIEGYHDPVYRDVLEMTGQVHALNYLKGCRGGTYVPNPT